MKTTLLILAIFTAGNLLAGDNVFEGVVDFRFSMNGPMQTMRYFLKPGYQRVEAGEGADLVIVIFDMKAKKSYVVIDADQAYMEEALNLPDSETKSENAHNTGKMLTIAGFVCEQWIVNDSAGNHQLCLNDQLGGFVSMDFGMRQSGNFSTFERLVVNRFPLRLTTNGKLQFEVTKIEAKNLDDKVFKPPIGFKQLSVP